ncbi:MAG: hypothetical protein GY722_19300, partial [bacterium]|nr:hypothetical protein [bacterium]
MEPGEPRTQARRRTGLGAEAEIDDQVGRDGQQPASLGQALARVTDSRDGRQALWRDGLRFTDLNTLLRSCDLQPHRVVEWMNRKADPDFDAQAREVKEVLVAGQSDSSGERVAVSFDEKTGMQ